MIISGIILLVVAVVAGFVWAVRIDGVQNEVALRAQSKGETIGMFYPRNAQFWRFMREYAPDMRKRYWLYVLGMLTTTLPLYLWILAYVFIYSVAEK